MEVELITFVIDCGRQPVVIDRNKEIQKGIISVRLGYLFQYQFLWVTAVNVLFKICVVGAQKVINIPTYRLDVRRFWLAVLCSHMSTRTSMHVIGEQLVPKVLPMV
jgi:hypothetical protein